jgi:hypothetical protein
VTCVQGSFLDLPFTGGPYGCVLSEMAMHHYERAQKLTSHRKIRESPAVSGCFVVGDYIVSQADGPSHLARHRQMIGDGFITPGRLYHVDIPSSVFTETQVLLEAGFSWVGVAFETADAAVLAAQRL